MSLESSLSLESKGGVLSEPPASAGGTITARERALSTHQYLIDMGEPGLSEARNADALVRTDAAASGETHAASGVAVVELKKTATEHTEDTEQKPSSLILHPSSFKRRSQYDLDPTVVLDDRGIVCNHGHPMFGLKRSFDSNGREIFVAREYEHDQKPKLWYTYTSKPGTLNRWEHQGVGITGKHVHEVTDRYEI